MAAGRGGQAGGQTGGQAGQKGDESSGDHSAAGQGGSAGYLKGNYEYIKKRVRQYPVSYTHLDVYKRQAECGPWFIRQFAVPARRKGMSLKWTFLVARAILK